MKGMPVAALSLLAAGSLLSATAQNPPATVPQPYPTPRPGPYTLGPESQEQPGVAKGTLSRDTLAPGQAYPGVPHTYQVYVPANLDGSRPAPLMVFADGLSIFCGPAIQAPVALDNLIDHHDIPPLVAIFVDPGVLPATDAATAQNRYNRTHEYDAIDGRFARFLSEELIPEVTRKFHLNVSSDPSDRAIGGVSTGAVAAFVAAWERPDQFRRVLSYIGTFVDMKGANTLPFVIRKTEPRPLRVFLQDGANDQNSAWGSWFQQNQEMDWALTYMRYDHVFVVGTDGHSTAHGGAIFPDAMRWLWRDYPAKIAVPEPEVVPARGRGTGAAAPASVLYPAPFNVVEFDHPWEAVGDKYPAVVSPTGDRDGNVYFTDPGSSRIYRADADGHVALFRDGTNGATALRVGPDGRVYAAQPGLRRIVSYGPAGDETLVARNVEASGLAMTKAGVVYFSDTGHRTIGMVVPGRNPRTVYSGSDMAAPTALAFSPDQSMLQAMDARSKFGWSFQRSADGLLKAGEPFWRLEFSEQVDLSTVGGVAVDTLGYLYVPTAIGIELSNQIGRVETILNKPEPTAAITHVAFGGRNRNWLYVATAAGKLYRRPVKRTGAAPWDPVKPPTPTL